MGSKAARRLGFLGVLPLYLAFATAIGFVDYKVRPYPAYPYTEYVPAVVHGTADPPARYRVLAPLAYDGLVRATHLSAEDGWLVFRWLCLVAAFAAGHLYFRTWFSTGGALVGNALVATLLPLTFTNSYAHPDHLVELCLFTLGCACVARGWMAAFLGVLVLATLNRETAFLLVVVLVCAGPLDRRRLGWAAAGTVLWAATYAGLRWRLGYVPYNPLQVSENLGRLFWWPAGRDLYYRLYSWFFLIMLAPALLVIARSWPLQPRFTRGAVAIALPFFLLIGLTFSSVIEPRIFTILLPLVVPGVLFAALPGEREPLC